MTSLIALLTSTLLCSFIMGALQYFVLEQLTAIYGMDGRAWITQAVAATVTIGPALIYFFSGALVSAFRKATVMAVSVAGVLALIFMILFSLKGGCVQGLWVSLTLIGVFLGLYSAGKMSAIPFVQANTTMSMAAVNGLMSMVFIFGLMPGAFCGTMMYQKCPDTWHYILGAFSLVSVIISLLVRPKGETFIGYREAQRNIWRGTGSILKSHWTILFAGASLWGSANAVQMALNAYLTMHEYASISVAALIPVAAAVGAVIGTVTSPLFNRVRFVCISLFTLLMGLTVFLVPVMCHCTMSVMILTVIMGVFFGLAVNLNDSTFLEIAQQGGFVGVGASLQSALLAVMSASVSLLVYFLLEIFKVVTPDQTFMVFSLICLLIFFLTFAVGFKYGNRFYNPAVILLIVGVKLLMKLRYKITLKGSENLQRRKGMLILPNHPAEMDPVMEVLTFWRYAFPRVVVIEDFYSMPALNWLFKRIDAIPMPDIEGTVSPWKRRRVDKALDKVVEALKNGDNVLFYPGGALWRQDHEVIGAKSGLYYILSKFPEAEIALAHISGLWGSSFSYVYKHGRPDLFAQLGNGLKSVLTNLIFFVPKRPVTIEIAMAGKDFPRPGKDKMELNAWIQKWHDQFGPEPLTLYPYNRWSGKLPELAKAPEKIEVDESQVNDKILADIKNELATIKKIDPNSIKPGDRLTEELGMDSLEVAELLSWLGDVYRLTDVAPQELVNVAAIAHFAAGASQEIKLEDVPTAPDAWFEGLAGRTCGIMEANTITEALLKAIDRGGKLPMVADDTFGILSYEKFKMVLVIFASLIKDLPGERIGIMLPSTTLCDILLFATGLAGKTPVMLNWTLGEANLKQVVAKANLDVVLSAGAFIDKVDNLPVELFEEKLVLVEDLKRKIGFGHKIKALRQKGYSASKMLKVWGLDKASENDTAVVLFTSGSENVPKGVPLSHRNLLSNVAGCFNTVELKADDVLYSFLPPFHSFGMTMTTLLPTLGGIRTVHHPDPTAYRKIAQGIYKWKVTVAGGTATFIRGFMKAGQPEFFKSLALVGAGGEKTPKELFDMMAQRTPWVHLIEGYGITECSPLLCLSGRREPVVGVGRPLTGVTVKVVDMNTYEDIPAGTQGLIIAKGLSVFHGYLGGSPDPFIEVAGEKWYNTGDLGYFTNGGQLIINGRLKRFAKIGGEMVSLPALEAVLNHKWPSPDERPLLAVEYKEKDGERPELVLFSALPNLTAEEANAALREAGIGNVARLSRVVIIPEMPLLGTGKTDYRSLKALI